MDALGKLLAPREKASSLDPTTVAALLETVAIIKLLNERSEHGKSERSEENRVLVQKLEALLDTAGGRVFQGACVSIIEW